MSSYPYSNYYQMQMQYHPYPAVAYSAPVAYEKQMTSMTFPAKSLDPKHFARQIHEPMANYQTSTVPRIPRVKDSYSKSASFNSYIHYDHQNPITPSKSHSFRTRREQGSKSRTPSVRRCFPQEGTPPQYKTNSFARSHLPPSSLQLSSQTNDDSTMPMTSISQTQWIPEPVKYISRSLPRRSSGSDVYGPSHPCFSNFSPIVDGFQQVRSQTLPRSSSSSDKFCNSNVGPHKLLKACRSPSMDSGKKLFSPSFVLNSFQCILLFYFQLLKKKTIFQMLLFG
jgi:hypothetical protein